MNNTGRHTPRHNTTIGEDATPNQEQAAQSQQRRPLKERRLVKTHHKMTADEVVAFEKLDKIVANFVKDAFRAGEALRQIRERRLYRAKFDRLEDYCNSVHQMTRQYVNRLIQAEQVYREMEPIVSSLGLEAPRNEAQLRVLAKLDSIEDRVAVFKRALDLANENSASVTAKSIQKLNSSRKEKHWPPPQACH